MAEETHIETTNEQTPEQQAAALLEARLKEERPKIYGNALNEARERERKSWAGIFEKHGLQIGDNPEEAIANLFKTVKQSETKTKETEEEVSLKIQSALQKADLASKERDEAISEKNRYILQHQVASAIGSKAINANAAVTLLMNEYKFELGKDGSVKIKNKSGDMVRNETYEPADLDYVVNSFLEKNSYLAVATVRKTDKQDQDLTAGAGIDFLKKDASEWTEAERQRVVKMFKDGKIVHRGGQYVVVG